MKVGDCVRVVTANYNWTGICTWTDGYKFEFLIDGEFDTWTRNDLETVGAEVIGENRRVAFER